MYVTGKEREAFHRGQAAGLIAPDTQMPENEAEMDSLVVQTGWLFVRMAGCRNRRGEFFFSSAAAFTAEHLAAAIRHLPRLKPEVRTVTATQRDVYLNPLASLGVYFDCGAGIIDARDLENRMAGVSGKITPDMMRKGFELQSFPEPIPGLATAEQKIALSRMAFRRLIPPFTRRQWDNLTGLESAAIIRAGGAREPAIPSAVRDAVAHYQRLTLDEKILFRQIVSTATPFTARKTA